MLPYSTRSFIGRGNEGHAHDERVAREEVEEVALGDLYLSMATTAFRSSVISIALTIDTPAVSVG
jgi:hypothetical protein